MKFIIFSDSHGFDTKMLNALKLNLPAGLESRLDGMIFLGDGLSGAKRIANEANLKFYAVAGNCDSAVDLTKLSSYEQLIDLEGKKVMIMHGHRFSVKNGAELAVSYARAKSADILLYGHTHIRECTYLAPENGRNALHIFNPGSISLPKDGVYSFGLMEIRGNGVLLSHGAV